MLIEVLVEGMLLTVLIVISTWGSEVTSSLKITVTELSVVVEVEVEELDFEVEDFDQSISMRDFSSVILGFGVVVVVLKRNI